MSDQDSFRIEGGDALRDLAKVMRKVPGGGELRKALLAGLRAAAQPAADDMRTTLAARLPKRGGAGKALTKKKRTFAVRNRLSDSDKTSAGVRIMSTDDVHDYASLEDRGRLRHPVHPGNRPRRSWRWVEQKVPTEGLLADVLHAHEGQMLEGITDAMNDAALAVEAALDRGV